MRKRFLVLLALPFAMLPGSANAASPDECNAYADAAMRQVQENGQLGCGLAGGNWSPSRDAHMAWCLQTDIGKVKSEQDFRENELNQCKQRHATGAGNATPDQCNVYADVAMQQVQANGQLGCGLQGGNWAPNRDAHLSWCLQNTPDKVKAEQDFRENEINQCKQRLAGQGGGGNAGGGGNPGGGNAGGGTGTVVKPVTMYKDKNGKDDLCYLVAGDKVAILAPDGAEAPWMHLQGTSGDCNGKAGFLYNSGEVAFK